MNIDQVFMLNQIKVIDEAKWLEGCNRNEDPGQDFIIEWIHNNAAEFRKVWENSMCCKCFKSVMCGFKCKEICDNFIKSLKAQLLIVILKLIVSMNPTMAW